MYDIITAKLRSLNKEFEYVERNSDLSRYLNDAYIILTWHPEDVENDFNSNKNILNII